MPDETGGLGRRRGAAGCQRGEPLADLPQPPLAPDGGSFSSARAGPLSPAGAPSPPRALPRVRPAAASARRPAGGSRGSQPRGRSPRALPAAPWGRRLERPAPDFGRPSPGLREGCPGEFRGTPGLVPAGDTVGYVANDSGRENVGTRWKPLAVTILAGEGSDHVRSPPHRPGGSAEALLPAHPGRPPHPWAATGSRWAFCPKRKIRGRWGQGGFGRLVPPDTDLLSLDRLDLLPGREPNTARCKFPKFHHLKLDTSSRRRHPQTRHARNELPPLILCSPLHAPSRCFL